MRAAGEPFTSLQNDGQWLMCQRRRKRERERKPRDVHQQRKKKRDALQKASLVLANTAWARLSPAMRQARRWEPHIWVLCPASWVQQCNQATPARKGWLTGETAPPPPPPPEEHTTQFGNRWPSLCVLAMASTLWCIEKTKPLQKVATREESSGSLHSVLWELQERAEDGTRRESREKVLSSLCPVPSFSGGSECELHRRTDSFGTVTHSHYYLLSREGRFDWRIGYFVVSFSLSQAPISILCSLSLRGGK